MVALLGATAAAEEPGACLADAAREQVGVTVRYDPSYRVLAYPGGDVPVDRGVCSDVLVRAYRRFGVDLQRLVHEDMERAWTAYPKLWGLQSPDASIDHRRVPNLATFFGRHGQRLPVGTAPEGFAAGDLVTWRLPTGVPHIGIVTGRRGASGSPLVVHNIGRGVVEEDILMRFTITGHYRYLPEALVAECAARGRVGAHSAREP